MTAEHEAMSHPRLPFSQKTLNTVLGVIESFYNKKFLICFGHFGVISDSWLKIGDHMLDGAHLSGGSEGDQAPETNQLRSACFAI